MEETLQMEKIIDELLFLSRIEAADKRKLDADLYLDDVQVFSGPPEPHKSLEKPLVEGIAENRVAEKLDRGIVALPGRK